MLSILLFISKCVFYDFENNKGIEYLVIITAFFCQACEIFCWNFVLRASLKKRDIAIREEFPSRNNLGDYSNRPLLLVLFTFIFSSFLSFFLF